MEVRDRPSLSSS